MDHPFLTASLTLFCGVVLYCANSLFTRFVIEPLEQVRKTIGEISYCLQYHAWVICMGRDVASEERYKIVFDELRSHAARLRANANSLIGYDFYAKCGLVPPHADLVQGCGCLIGLSNFLGSEKWDTIDERFEKAGKMLRIDVGRPNFKRDNA